MCLRASGQEFLNVLVPHPGGFNGPPALFRSMHPEGHLVHQTGLCLLAGMSTILGVWGP